MRVWIEPGFVRNVSAVHAGRRLECLPPVEINSEDVPIVLELTEEEVRSALRAYNGTCVGVRFGSSPDGEETRLALLCAAIPEPSTQEQFPAEASGLVNALNVLVEAAVTSGYDDEVASTLLDGLQDVVARFRRAGFGRQEEVNP